jgi:antagonist of KipI
MSVTVLRPGLLTTVQDLGRYGYQKDGILVSGAMDVVALRTANLLVGNLESAAGLEITLLGPRLRFEAGYLIALTGANLSPTIQGQPVGLHRPVWVGAGTELAFGAPRVGSRAYLAVAGGFDVTQVLGSRSTYLRAGFGGLHGRAVQAGDELPVAAPTPVGQQLGRAIANTRGAATWAQASWHANPQPYPPQVPQRIRAIAGPEYEQFSASSQQALWEQAFTVTPQADRMGYRLQGPTLTRATDAELLSSAVTFGTVQVPAGGQAIVLLADHQTTGGYPRVAQAITADFSVLAQLRPGQELRFEQVSLADAHALYLAQERRLHALQRAIHSKLLA